MSTMLFLPQTQAANSEATSGAAEPDNQRPPMFSWQDDKCVLSFDLRNNDFLASNCYGVKEHIPENYFYSSIHYTGKLRCLFNSAIDTNVYH